MPEIKDKDFRRYSQLAPHQQIIVRAVDRYQGHYFTPPPNRRIFVSVEEDSIVVHTEVSGFFQVFTVEEHSKYYRIRGGEKTDKWKTILKID